jgi:hypothetical protein
MNGKKRSQCLRALGLALVASLAIAATSAGSASALSLTPEPPGTYPVSLLLNTGKAPGKVKIAFGTVFNVECESATEGGKLTSGTSGELKITYGGCRLGKSTCTSAGQPSGTMVTSNLAVTPVYLNVAKTIWGFKLTPIGTTVFAECNFPGENSYMRLSGSVLGDVPSALGTTTRNLTLRHAKGSKWEEQKYQQIEGAGTKYHLEMVIKAVGQEAQSLPEAALVVDNPITAFSFLTINP